MDEQRRRELAPEVRRVLEEVPRDPDGKAKCLTAYQVLARMNEARRRALIESHGAGGRGAGHAETAASIVSQVLTNELFNEVEIIHLDAREVTFSVAGEVVQPGNRTLALYRLRSQD